MATQADLDRLYAQQSRLLDQAASIDARLAPLENKVNQGIQLTTSEAQAYFDLSEQQEDINSSIFSVGRSISDARSEVQNLAAQQSSAPAVDPDNSPAAAQADAAEEPGFFARLFGSNEDDSVDESPYPEFDEFSGLPSDLSVPPPPPTPEPVDVDPAEDPFAEGADVNVTEETVREVPQRPPQDDIDRAFGVLATPEIDDNTTIDEFSTVVTDDNGQVVGYGSIVDDPQQQLKPTAPAVSENNDPTVRVETPAIEEAELQRQQDEIAQVNNAALQQLRAQSVVQQQRGAEGSGDWRVKLRLASGANNFYKAPFAGILEPLRATDGIVFPYTPSIQTLYTAEYNQYHPTHSNYQHYFYKGSKVGEIVLTGTFTAQDTVEANYVLAVIHFLKSASKMFYGQDADRGSPPPLLFLSGLGDYQFNESPCVISQFNYILPDDVDYIRANVQQIPSGSLQTDLRNRSTGNPTWSSSIRRLLSTPGLTFGAEPESNFSNTGTVNLSSDNATYVPTKLEITITMLPVQNRLQVSEGFSLREYANGNLIKGGFW